MKAVVYPGQADVRVDDKPKPKIERQEDIILVTKTAICGSGSCICTKVKSMEWSRGRRSVTSLPT
ncbi:MAG TPA: hypothetical protein VF172_03655 [Nitrososphaera sp.]